MPLRRVPCLWCEPSSIHVVETLGRKGVQIVRVTTAIARGQFLHIPTTMTGASHLRVDPPVQSAQVQYLIFCSDSGIPNTIQTSHTKVLGRKRLEVEEWLSSRGSPIIPTYSSWTIQRFLFLLHGTDHESRHLDTTTILSLVFPAYLASFCWKH